MAARGRWSGQECMHCFACRGGGQQMQADAGRYTEARLQQHRSSSAAMHCGDAHLAAWRLCGTGGRWHPGSCCAALAGWGRAWRQAGKWWRLTAASQGAERTPGPAPAAPAATPSEPRAAGAAATAATGWAGASQLLPRSRCKSARPALPAELLLLLGPGRLWRHGCGGLSTRRTGTAGSQCCHRSASSRQCRRCRQQALSGPQTAPGDAALVAAAGPAAAAAAPRATRAVAAEAPDPPWEAPWPPLQGAASATPRPAILLASPAASPQSGRAGGSCCCCRR